MKKYLAFKFSHRIITSQESIQYYLKRKYKLDIDLIELGGDHVSHIESTSLDHKQYSFLKYMYSVSYFCGEPNSHLEIILDSFKRCKNKYIVIIGDWNETNRGTYLKNKYAGYSNIYMLYPFEDERTKDLIISNSILYIHSSSTACYSYNLIEAMSLKLPVVAFESTDNLYVTEGRAAYFKNVSELYHFIDNMSIEKLRRNAISMRNIASIRFSWKAIVEKYGVVFDELYSSDLKKLAQGKIRYIDKLSEQLMRKELKPRFTFFYTFFNLFL